MSDRKRLEEIVRGFPGVKIAVIGDLVADIFVYGHTRRVSREAPVLILDYLSEKVVHGGAANAVHNVWSLGARPLPIGVLGRDHAGSALREDLIKGMVDTRHIVELEDRVTTTKQRFVGSSLHTTFQQILRVDRGRRDPVDARTESLLLRALDEACAEVGILIVSDYGYGVMTPALIERVNQIGKENRVKVMIDSRYRLGEFRHEYVMTPNEPEAQEASGVVINTLDDVREAGRRLLERSEAEAVLITRGKQGMELFFRSGDEKIISIFGTDEITDVTGAGDTVIAAFAAATGAGAGLLEAAVIANVAGGLVVMKSGTATVTADELLAAMKREDPWHVL